MMRKRVFYIRMAACAAAAVLTAAVNGGCARRSSGDELTVQGLDLLENGSYQEALTVLEQAVQGGEESVPALRAEGLAYMALAMYDEAIAAFEQALEETDEKMPETRKDIRMYLALAYLRNEDYGEVISQCSLLTQNDGDSTEVSYYLGAAYLGLGDQDQARTYFDAAVSSAPSDYALYLQIYKLFEEASLSAVGDMYLQEALAVSPTSDEQKVQVGQIYCYLEQYDQARAVIDDSANNRYMPAMLLLGQIYLAQDDYTHAKSTYQSIMDQEGESPVIYNGLALCAMAEEDYDTALLYIKTGLALDEEEGKQQLRFNELVAYEKKLDFTTALTKAEVYVQLYPTDEAGRHEYEFLRTQG